MHISRPSIVLLLAVSCLVGLSFPAEAQHLSPAVQQDLRQREDSLKGYSDSIVNAATPEVRFRSDSQFVRSLVRALKQPYSFYYPFDSLQTISHLYAPDSTFRIFTWQFKKDEFLYLQEGAIQMNQPDGSLKLFPLFDASMFTDKPDDSVRTRKNWIGAIYYRIIEKTWEGRNYYTLLGFDDYSETSNKKWMEVLTFNPAGEPQFGGPYFSFAGDSVHKKMQYRFNIEYKKEAATRFNYDPEMDMVVYDHLVPEGDQPQKKDTYVPDGDFEAFQWKDGHWLHIEKKLFTFKLKDGEAPTEGKILDDQGNIDETKLQESSDKNAKKKKNDKPAPAKKPGS
ncbi:hypothetical protein [Puia dinghuensis]|uniref:Outer membrane lipoprotein-sorting protein n=1 Tax=Puia dinghuensis TaxID=1792502 RepID=A0A8J2U855_9BACT|nr:hypothetical protein [Puia dinghuensis]GGA85961.1 hypothetical protein GCM10011511_06280 [Puia dinghuensis]